MIFLTYFLRASALVAPLPFGSKRPVSKLTLDTGFFNSLSPICSNFSRFSFVAISTEESVPVNVSSWCHI